MPKANPDTGPALSGDSGPIDSGKASWSRPDNKALLTYLVEHQAEAGDGGNFKPKTFRAAAAVVNLIRTKGGVKTFKSCSGKYAALRKEWHIVDHIKDTSGYAWNDDTGVNVSPAMRGTWTEYVKVFPAAARFEKIGWPFHELMAPLMPSKAKGGNVFRPGGAPETGGARSSSPGWDEEQMNRDFGGEDKDDDDEMEGNGGGAGGPDDDDDGDGDGETSSPLASGKTGKRVAAQAAPIYRKKPRLSAGGQALTDIASSAAEFNEIFAGFRDAVAPAAAPTPATNAIATTATPDPAAGTSTATTAPAPAFQPSPQRRLNAIQFAKQEAWLDPPYRVALVRVLRNIIKADEYAGLVDEDAMRIQWIIHELGEVGIMVFHPLYSNLELDFDV